MQAVILAAGMGKRLKELTKNNTKCMVKVNGVTLIERLLRQLEAYKLSRVVIVVGYEGRKLKEFIATLNIETPIEYVENPIYYKTNNIYSLALAKEYLCKEDTLLFESDLIVEDSVIRELINDPRETLALVDKYESWMDGTCVKLSDKDEILEFVPGKKFTFDEIKSYYKTVNIYKFGRHFSQTHYVPFLDAYSNAMGNNEYYEQVLKIITMLDDPEIQAKRLHGELWYEIDDIQDLDIASSMFLQDDDKIAALQRRYGGYWRYPKLLDYCYLVNPYFPPQRLLDEIKASFEILATQYPSGMGVNSLLAAKNFGVARNNIAVGNGAAELIKSIMSVMKGTVGIIRPTFEEYPNRCGVKQVVYTPANDDYAYSADDIMRYFTGKDIRSLIVINPDNPSGNYMAKNDMLRLADWAKDSAVQLLIDESFADFADDEHASMMEQDFLNENTHVIVIKSISKCYGVPGLRLGVVASGDEKLIDFVKKDVGIWNINSFAEFYLQIAEKYSQDYQAALRRFREERRRFTDLLKTVSKGIRVVPTQANYCMLELTNGITSARLTKRLLLEHNILIKDLSGKLKTDRQYVRIAIRNENDNNKLIAAIRAVLEA